MVNKSILYIVHSLPRGGIETILLNLCEFLIKSGWRVTIACLVNKGEHSCAFEELGVKIIVLRGKSSLGPSSIPRNILTFFKLIHIIRSLHPHVVQCEMFFAGCLGRCAAFLCKVPKIVYGVHNCYNWKGPTTNLVERLLYKITTNVITPTMAVCEHAQKNWKVPCRKFNIISNGIKVSVKTKTSSMIVSPDEEVLNIVFCGRMVHQKRPDLAIEIVKELGKHHRNVSLTMIGDGPLLKNTIEAAEAASIDVSFTGSHPSPSDIIQNCHLLILPSLIEGFSIIVGESILVGTPVLMADLPPLREAWYMCPEACFIHSWSPLDWAHRIEKLFFKGTDEEKGYSRLTVENWKREVEKAYSVKRMCSAYIKMYESKPERVKKIPNPRLNE